MAAVGEHTTWAQWRAAGTRLDRDGLPIAIYDVGQVSGPVLSFLHGFPSSSLDVAAVAAGVGPGYRVLALDFPGFGASAKPAGHAYSIHAATDAVEDMWRAAEVSSTVLLAHDYGVSVGQELLARRAEGALDVEVNGVIWMNGGLYPDLHRPTIGQQMLLDPDHGAEIAAAIDEAAFVDGVRNTWGERVEMRVGDGHEMWSSMDDGGGVAIMHELVHYIADRRTHEQRWRHALETCDLPMTFVWGDLDPVSGAHMIEHVEERLPDATVVRLADVGHWPPIEAPDAVVQAIETMTGSG